MNRVNAVGQLRSGTGEPLPFIEYYRIFTNETEYGPSHRRAAFRPRIDTELEERALTRLTISLAALAFVVATTGGSLSAQTPQAEKKSDASTASQPAERKAPVKIANGTVKSAGADSIVVSGKEKGKDVEWTFTLNDKTQIKKAGKDVVTKDLAVGDGVNVRYIDQDGKSVASAINVRSKPAAAK